MSTRYSCNCQPMINLQNGVTDSHLTRKYTSLPPQFVITKALLAHRFVLAAVSLNALLINLLSVALSNLFSQSLQILTRASLLSSQYSPILQVPAGTFPILPNNSSSQYTYVNNFTTQDIYYTAKSHIFNGGDFLPGHRLNTSLLLSIRRSRT